MAKKLVFISVALLLLLSACGQATFQNDRLSIVTTIFPPYDFARQITGDNADVTMLLSPGSEVHSYEPTVKDLAAIQKCDIFVYIGSDSDKWVEKMLSSVGRDDIITIKMTDCVSLQSTDHIEGMQDENHAHEDADEHVWTSLRNARKIADAICDAACKKDARNADCYRENMSAFADKLSALDAEITDIVSCAKKDTLVFSERFPFLYFAKDYGLKYYAAFHGCAVENDVSFATIAFLVSKINELSLNTVFYTEFSTEKIADTICEGTGAKKALFHSCHNVSRADFDSGVTYLDLMRANAAALKEALN